MILAMVSLVFGLWVSALGRPAVKSHLQLQTQIAATPRSEAERLRALFHESDEAYLKRNPIAAIFRGDLRYADRFGDYCSDAYFGNEKAAAEADLNALTRVNRANLSAIDRVAYDVFKYQTERTLAGFVPEIFALQVVRPINHMDGVQVFYPTFSSGQGAAPFSTLVDYENNLKRHHEMTATIDCSIIRFREGLKAGVVDTKMTIQNVIDQLDIQLAQKPEESPYYGPVRKFPQPITDSDQRRLREAYVRVISTDVFPAYQRLRDFLRNEYLPKAREGFGLVHMKDGRRLYDFLIENSTTVKMTADEVHDLGLSEVARIRAAMVAISKEVGFTGSLGEFFQTHPERTSVSNRPAQSGCAIAITKSPSRSRTAFALNSHRSQRPSSRFVLWSRSEKRRNRLVHTLWGRLTGRGQGCSTSTPTIFPRGTSPASKRCTCTKGHLGIISKLVWRKRTRRCPRSCASGATRRTRKGGRSMRRHSGLTSACSKIRINGLATSTTRCSGPCDW